MSGPYLDGYRGSYAYQPHNLEYLYADVKGINLEEKPELTLVWACSKCMGMPDICAENQIWSAFRDRKLFIVDEFLDHRKIMPEIVRRILKEKNRENIFRELYFSFVIPVVAAMDAGEADIAYGIYIREVEMLKKKWLGE